MDVEKCGSARGCFEPCWVARQEELLQLEVDKAVYDTAESKLCRLNRPQQLPSRLR